MKTSSRQAVDARSSAAVLALDAVRGAAAMLVLLGHARGGTWVEFGALPAEQKTWLVSAFFLVTRLGSEAVMVFFVLSGFLVGGKIIGRVIAGSFSVSEYALERAVRILIPLVPACIFTAAIDAYFFGVPLSASRTLANMVGLNNVVAETLGSNAPLWSLTFEIWFYVAGGAIAGLFVEKRKLPAFLVLAVSTLVFAKIGATYVLFWVLGAFTVFILHQDRKGWSLLAGAFLMLVGVVSFQLGLASKSIVSIKSFPQEVAEGLMCMGFCLCLPFLCTDQMSAWLRRFGGFISFMSAISYSVYLFHYPILTLLNSVASRNLCALISSPG